MKKAIYGYGGHAIEVSKFIDEDITFFVDDEWSKDIARPISSFDPNEFKIIIAVGNSKDRFDILSRLPKNTKFFSFIHPTSIILDNVEIGEGTYIGPFCLVTTNIKLGKHSILNRGCQIGHDSNIGDFFTAMPGSIVSGDVKIGIRSYLGTNSSIKEKITICDDVIIGLNSGVVKDILEPGVYGGVPVKKIKNI
jgi:sugar O-acyltransferase (sialic acid O-acetyltransferase NeuD family)